MVFGGNPHRPRIASVVVVVLCIVLAVTGAVTVIATHEDDRTTDGYKAFTADGDIPKPGETYPAELYMAPAYADHDGPVPPKLEFHVDYVVFYDARDASSCSESEVRTAGIDRGNNDSGTTVDEDLLPSLWEFGDYETGPENDPGPVADNGYEYRHATFAQLAPEDALASDPVYINTHGIQDEGVLAVEDCVTMPDKSGWYRNWLYVNGSVEEIHGEDDEVTVQGETYSEGDYIEGWQPSKWYPVCQCDNMVEVEETLGPPPGEAIEGPEGGTVTPTPDEDESTGTATETAAEETTAEGTPDGSTTDEPTSTGTTDEGRTAETPAEESPTETFAENETGGDDGEESGPETPADGDGFGVLTVVGLVLVSLLAHRRWRE